MPHLLRIILPLFLALPVLADFFNFQGKIENNQAFRCNRDGLLMTDQEDYRLNGLPLTAGFRPLFKVETAPLSSEQTEVLKKQREQGQRAARLYGAYDQLIIDEYENWSINRQLHRQAVYYDQLDPAVPTTFKIPVRGGLETIVIKSTVIIMADGQVKTIDPQWFIEPTADLLGYQLLAPLPLTAGTLFFCEYERRFNQQPPSSFSAHFVLNHEAPTLNRVLEVSLAADQKVSFESFGLDALTATPKNIQSPTTNLRTYQWTFRDLEPATVTQAGLYLTTAIKWPKLNQSTITGPLLTAWETSKIGLKKSDDLFALTQWFNSQFKVTDLPTFSPTPVLPVQYSSNQGHLVSSTTVVAWLYQIFKETDFDCQVVWYNPDLQKFKVAVGYPLTHWLINVSHSGGATHQIIPVDGSLFYVNQGFSLNPDPAVKAESAVSSPKTATVKQQLKVEHQVNATGEIQSKYSLDLKGDPAWQVATANHPRQQFHRFLPQINLAEMTDFIAKPNDTQQPAIQIFLSSKGELTPIRTSQSLLGFCDLAPIIHHQQVTADELELILKINPGPNWLYDESINQAWLNDLQKLGKVTVNQSTQNILIQFSCNYANLDEKQRQHFNSLVRFGVILSPVTP